MQSAQADFVPSQPRFQPPGPRRTARCRFRFATGLSYAVRASTPLLALVLAACASAAPAPLPMDDEAHPACPEDGWQACMDSVELAAMTAAGRRVSRQGGALVFALPDDPPLELVPDTSDADRWIVYRYRRYHPAPGLHEVDVGYYEGRQTLLVNARTGEQSFVHGPPVFSPDGRRFATTSVDLVAGYDRNGIWVWRLDGGRVVEEVGLDGGDAWGASHARWVDARTVEFRRHLPDPSTPAGSVWTPWRLRLQGDGHTLSPAR